MRVDHSTSQLFLSQTAKTTASRGIASTAKTLLISMLTFGLIVGPVQAELPATTVIPASGKTNAYISANGVPVVNIETANAAGLSHNKLLRYDVEANGVVLNNGNNTQVVRQSQLAGQVIANQNLVKEATSILMEVVSTNRSTLAGFQEVLGGKADVIVANPNGITCNGCGFINTDRVTLTTGQSNVASNGNLTGFTVNRGDILVQGLGANANTQQIFDLVARSIKVDGKINVPAANTLGLTVGANVWDYTSRNVSGSATASGTAPSYAFDSTALGGMYAGRIRIVATEAGVGVRMLGEVAASADDFTLSSAGKVEIQSALSAARDASITVTSATGSQDLYLNGAGAKVSATRNADIAVASGETKLSQAELYAGGNLGLTGGTLSDTSTAANTRYAGGNSSVTMAGAATIDGGVWGAGGALAGSFDSLAIGTTNSGKLYAGTTLDLTTVNNMALTTAAIRSGGNMSLTATNGNISTTSGAAQGVQTTDGNLSLTAGNGITSAGTVTADAGAITVRVNGTVNNSGTIHAKTSIDLADKSGGSTENITNSGTILAVTSITAKAAAVTNQAAGTIQGTTGTTLSATSLANAGTFTVASAPNQSGTLTLTNLDNSGTLQSSQDLTINASGTLANSGTVLASNNLAVNAGASNLAISNTASGVLQATNALTVTGSGATLNTQAGKVLGNTVAMTLSSLNNSGTLQSETTTNLTVGNTITNSGTQLAKTTLTSSSASLTNSGTMQANNGAAVTVANALSNTGTILASNTSNHSGTLTVGTLSNTGAGVIQSAQNLNVNVTGGALTNSKKIIANNNLTVTSTGGSLALNNNAGGYLQAGTASGDALTVNGNAVTLNNNFGATLLGNQVNLTTSAITNGGTIQGGTAASTVSATGAITNTGLFTLSNTSAGSGLVTAANLTNSGTLQSSGALGLIVGGGISNSGALLADGSLASSSSTLVNSGTLQSGQNLTASVFGGTLNNYGKMIAVNDLTVTSTGSSLALNNNTGGYIQAGSSAGDVLTVNGTGVILSNAAGASLMGNQLAVSALSLTNSGTIQAGAGASTITTSGTINNAGMLNLATVGTGSGTITASDIVNSGQLQSSGAAALNVASQLTNSNNIMVDGNLTIRGTGGTYTIDNTKLIQSGGTLDIKGQSGNSAVNINVGSNGVLLGDKMDVNANTIAVSNGGMVSTNGDMTLNASTLTFGGTTSRIVAATGGSGDANVTLSHDFSNVGAVHSGGNMTFKAPNIINTNTGGFSALDTLTVKATSGDVTNSGALYAGNQLNVQAPSGSITNVSDTGTMDSDGSISVTAGNTFTNNNTVNALRDIYISATTFRNELVGGAPTRYWTSIGWGADKQTSSNSENGDTTEYYEKYGSRNEYFNSTPPAVKPQIIAGRNMSIVGFSSGFNTGGVISASSGTLTINGSGSFTNDDLSLKTENYKATWNEYENCNSLGFDCDSWKTRSYEEHVTSTNTARSYGAGIFASSLNASGFNLYNQSSAWTASTTAKSATGASATSLSGAAQKTSGSAVGGFIASTSGGTSAVAAGTVNGKAAISFGGLVITLPTNPNGYFVTSTNPASKYLVETNPLFSVGSNYVGSDYMQNRYGYNPDTKVKLLGDANYEAYLIKQELIAKTGRNLLAGYANEKAQMQALMDNALNEGRQQGFVYGQALSETQISNLKQDVVWMVETNIGGQRVLAPVVYLSQATKDSIQTGAVIAGNKVNLNLTSLTNTGGTIQGADSLSVVSKNDITNTGGTITGGNVALQSTEGGIKNETVASFSGSDTSGATSIGKTAGIVATGNLSLDAKKDITVIGADVKAGGDATLAAGGKITFDTIVDKKADTTHTSSGLPFNSSSTTTTTVSEKNIGSNLSSGGNLTIKSVGDTTIAGSTVNVGGNFDATTTAGSLNIVARQDKLTTQTVTETSGFGVGGGIAGSEKKTTDDFKGTNVASNLTVGGNAKIKSAGDMTVQGSNVNVTGNAAIDAASIKVLDGLDERRTKTVTETTTYLSTGSKTGSESASSAESKSSGKAGSASAGANAAASAAESSELNFTSTTVKKQNDYKATSVASTLNVGGNLSLAAKDKIVVQGSDVKAGGDLSLDAKDVQILAGRNLETSTTDTKTTKTGIYTDSKAEANAEASASATGMTPNAKAGAEATASADSTITVGVRSETSYESSQTVTNRGSSLTSGGKTTIKATDTAKFVGATVDAGGDLDISAKNITNLAAQDTTLTTSRSSQTTTGVYLSGEASAETSANAKAGSGSMGASANGSAEAKAEVSVGLRAANETKNSEEGSVTNVVSSFKSGGNIKRTASNAIVDQGTQLEAAGDINQKAKTLTEIAAINKAWKSESSSSVDARIGVYADATAEATAGKGAGAGGKSAGASAEADASAGVKAKVTASQESSSEEATQAVTSRYKSGGSINSQTTEKTTLIGTQFDAGKDINIAAKSLDFQAARDTTSQSSSGKEGELMVKGGMAVSGGKVEAEGSYEQSDASASSSTARVGGLNAGGNLTIKTQDNLRLEGANVAAGGAVDLTSKKGSVQLEAAKSTTKGDNSGFNVSANIKVTGEGAEGGVSGGYNTGSSSSTTNTAVQIKSGTTTNIAAAKDVTLEGTKVDSGGSTSLTAGGTVRMVEVRDTEKSSQLAVQANAQLSKESQSGGVNVTAEGANKGESSGVQINSGGALNITGSKVVNQQADLKATGATTIVGAVETLNKTAKVDTGYSVDVGVDVVNKTPEKETQQPKAKTTDDIPSSKPKASPTPSKNKTTDDLPSTKSASTDTKSKADTIAGLKADQAKLNTTMAKKPTQPSDTKSPGTTPAVKTPVVPEPTKPTVVKPSKPEDPNYMKPTISSTNKQREKFQPNQNAASTTKKQPAPTNKPKKAAGAQSSKKSVDTTPVGTEPAKSSAVKPSAIEQPTPISQPTKAAEADPVITKAPSSVAGKDPLLAPNTTKTDREKTTTELQADKKKLDTLVQAKKEKDAQFFRVKDKIVDKSAGTGAISEYSTDGSQPPRELEDMEVKAPAPK
jgi:filamentous hemagglutinin family protein